MDKNKIQEQDIDAIIALLDGYVKAEGSRMKIQVTEGDGKVMDKKYHHGRCDVGSPWAQGAAFDVCE
jgi:hypothetical protein